MKQFKRGNYYRSEITGLIVMCTNNKGAYSDTFTGVVVVSDWCYQEGRESNGWGRDVFHEYKGSTSSFKYKKRTKE